jgi:thiamine transporter
MDKTKPRKSRKNLRALIESALLVAVGFVLSYIKLFELPQGGSVTALSMLPILMIGLRHGPKWGLCGGFVFACLQMLQSFWPPPSGTFIAYVAVILLDYALAFTVLGLSGIFRGRRYGMIYAAPLCIFLRFLCHFVSGIVIWSYYAGDTAAWIYSLFYNGPYMGIELVLTTIIGAILCWTAPMLFRVPGAGNQNPVN